MLENNQMHPTYRLKQYIMKLREVLIFQQEGRNMASDVHEPAMHLNEKHHMYVLLIVMSSSMAHSNKGHYSNCFILFLCTLSMLSYIGHVLST